MNFPKWLQSSADPTQLSLTIESGSKVIIGIIGSLIAIKGIDAAPITSQLQLIVDEVVTVIPMGFALYHALQTIWGLIRKLFMMLGNKPAPAAANTPAQQ